MNLDALTACAGNWHGTSTLQDLNADFHGAFPVTPQAGDCGVSAAVRALL